MNPLLRLVTLASLALFQATAAAQLSIEITGSGADRLPVAIAEFAGDPAQSKTLTATVRGDLERSGLFKLIDVGSKPIAETTAPDFAGWRGKGADALVGGSLLPTGDNRVEARFRLFDAARQQVLGGLALVSSPTQLRSAAHRISDFVYEKLIGERGAFSTRIAYVVKQGTRFELQIADADGQNPQAALISREPIISPIWSPDGNSLAYVSFENKKPIVYVHSLASGRRHVAANFKGSNSAPAWAPDGRSLAVVLTKDGGSQLFTVNADGSGVRRLARSPTIDTEPRYSPDGAWIYFTSDRGGSPQNYRIPAAGGDAQRITFEGAYNVTPRPSPDGKSMAYITSAGGKFQLAVMDLASRQTQILTDSDKDESPTYSPNGRMILF
ncbi:MAG TPA: Tol-Pal system beta propeller repeat protein TolB, partial [Rhodocyclaceae bacterium]|nr:Tol-Pal system beta propeller repeat protein TolB [Rhodocyclaceae bacterium]